MRRGFRIERWWVRVPIKLCRKVDGKGEHGCSGLRNSSGRDLEAVSI